MDRCGELKTLLLLYGEYSLEMEMNNYIKKPQTHGTDPLRVLLHSWYREKTAHRPYVPELRRKNIQGWRN